MRILLVDDDEALMETLAEALIRQRYAVDIATDGETAQEFLALFTYDLIVLDMLLPGVEGITLCQRFRRQGIDSPILMLTAKDSSTDKVRALDAGADDYVIKPFNFEELCARIRALLRRDSHTTTTLLRWGDASLKPDTFEVFYGEHQIHTTPKEYALLELFLRHPNRVYSLDTIIENLWSFQDPPGGDAVRTHIKGLRQKLKAGGAPKDLIETVYGVGYRLKPLVDADPAAVESSDATPMSPVVPTKSEITAAIATAWSVYKDEMYERLSVLETVAAAIANGQLSSDLQDAGQAQAHKLAGSLGCFGFPEGSRLARQLEDLLQLDMPLDYQQSSHISTTVQQLRQRLSGEDHTLAVPAAIANSARPDSPPVSDIPQIWVVGATEPFNHQFGAEAATAGFHSVTLPSPDAAQDRLQTQTPAIILLWIGDDGSDGAMALLEAVCAGSDHRPPIPILILTDIQDFYDRLHMAQQGASRLLSKSTEPAGIIDAIHHVQRADRADIKVVILDDDTSMLALLQTILLPWGFQLTTLDDPTQLPSVLETVQPNLLVLDVEMPEASGLEICQLLRADERWWQLPVLFLTVHDDITMQQQAFSVGADDFVRKSAMARELPMRILNRLKR